MKTLICEICKIFFENRASNCALPHAKGVVYSSIVQVGKILLESQWDLTHLYHRAIDYTFCCVSPHNYTVCTKKVP